MPPPRVKFQPTPEVYTSFQPQLTPKQKQELFTTDAEYRSAKAKAAFHNYNCPYGSVVDHDQCPYFTNVCYHNESNTCMNIYDHTNQNPFPVASFSSRPLNRKQTLDRQQFRQRMLRWEQARKVRQKKQKEASVSKLFYTKWNADNRNLNQK